MGAGRFFFLLACTAFPQLVVYIESAITKEELELKQTIMSLLLTASLLAGLLPLAVLAEETTVPFTPSVGAVTGYEKDGYVYDGFAYAPEDPDADEYGYIYPESRVDLYTVTVPFGAEGETLTFEGERLAYTYDAQGEYLRSLSANPDGYGENGQTGETTATLTAADFGSFVRVQTPYDESWTSTTLYAVQCRYAVSAGLEDGTPLPVSCSNRKYTAYYDQKELPVYTVEIPEGTENITLDFIEPMLAYSYKADGKTWVAGLYPDKTDSAYSENPSQAPLYTGERKTTVSVDADEDGTLDFVQVQTPYIYNSEGWDSGSEARYAVTFVYENGTGSGTVESQEPVSYAALLKGIAAATAYDSDPWTVLEQKAFDGQNHAPYAGYSGTSDAAKALAVIANSTEQTEVDAALDSLKDFDPTAPYAEYTAPYVLMAYDAAGVSLDDTRRQALLDCIVTALNNTGDLYYSADTVGMLLPALTPYSQSDRTIRKAVNNAINWLSQQQGANGSWGNANTDAMVITALSACGIDAHTDSRFIKSENGVSHSGLEALLGCGLYDGSGFGYLDGSAYNALATEQGFRALVAYARFQEGGKAYNIYTEAGKAVGTVTAPDIRSTVPPAPVTHSSHSGTISVDFLLTGNERDWLNDTVSIEKGSTVYDLLVSELTDNGYTYEGNSSYISYITNPAGTRLGEFTTGSNSGWLYRVDDTVPGVPIGSYQLTEDCAVTVYYTDDWTADRHAGSKGHSSMADPPAKADEPAEPADPPAVTAPFFADVPEDAFYHDAVLWAVEKAITNGTGETEFSPDGDCTRAQVVTFLWRAAGSPSPAVSAQTFSDVEENAYYSSAVLWGVEKGITNGTGENLFSPDRTITRAEAVTLLARYANGSGSGTLPFTDVPKDSYYFQSVQWAAEKGITAGTGKNTFSPKASCTRGQIVTFLYRLEAGWDTAALLQKSAAVLLSDVPDPQCASVGGEWTVIGLARSGAEIPQTWYDRYYRNLEAYVKDCRGVLHTRKYTEYSRVVLALTAIGRDPTDVGGYDLLAPLGDYPKVISQGITGPASALLALDAGGYAVPHLADPSAQATRQRYVEHLLSKELPLGGFALSGTETDPDVTGMVLQALAPYREQDSVQSAVDRALSRLSEIQEPNGGFSSWGTANAESCAQVLTALCTLSISPNDSRFVKNGHTVYDALLSYRLPDGRFSHEAEKSASNTIATEQGLCALAALRRAELAVPARAIQMLSSLPDHGELL